MPHDEKCSHNKLDGVLGYFLSWKGAVFVLTLAGISYYLLTQHLEHLAVALPYLFLLACPLMHIFGHGHGHKHTNSNDKE